MGIDIQLRNETGEVLAQVSDPKMVLSRATATSLARTRLLKYLMPSGDAVFNQAQAPDLAQDVALILREDPATPLSELLAEIRPLIDRLTHETHVYLWFVGD